MLKVKVLEISSRSTYCSREMNQAKMRKRNHVAIYINSKHWKVKPGYINKVIEILMKHCANLSDCTFNCSKNIHYSTSPAERKAKNSHLSDIEYFLLSWGK